MHRFICVLIAVLLPASAAAQQILVIDDVHLQLKDPGRPNGIAVKYSIRSASTIVLDASNYQFRVPPQMAGKSINAALVVLGKDRQYFTPWDSQLRKVVLSAKTLIPDSGSLPFSGFERGQDVIIAIGNKGNPFFDVVWTGLGKVE